MAEFEIDGVTYRTIKMSGRDQFHLLRKTGSLAGIFSRITTMDIPADEAMRNVALFSVLWKEFANLSQAQADDLLSHCLSYTRKMGGGNGAGPTVAMPMFQGRDMFEDTDIQTLMRICFEVIAENLGGFFPTGSVPEMSPPQPSPPSPPKEAYP